MSVSYNVIVPTWKLFSNKMPSSSSKYGFEFCVNAFIPKSLHKVHVNDNMHVIRPCGLVRNLTFCAKSVFRYYQTLAKKKLYYEKC